MKCFEPKIKLKDIISVSKLLYSGDIGFGSNVKKFEDKFSVYSNKKFNIGLNSASSAAYCIFAYLYDRYGKCEIYTPSIGFISPAWAAHKNGHDVIFVDVDDNLLFDFKSYEYEKRNTQLKKVLMPVLYGGVSNIPNFNEQVTDEIVVVDSAHCIEPTIKSDYIFFSFHPIKPLTMSNGGLLSTDNKDADNYIRKYRNFGRENRGDTYDIVSNGFNFYMNNLNATLGLSQLNSCFKNIKIRKKRLNQLKNSCILDIGYFTEHDDKSSYYLSTFILNKGGSIKMRNKLIKNGCAVSFHYPYLHQTSFRFNNGVSTLNNTDKLYDRIINLPIHQNLSKRDMGKIIKVISG
jgi:UDP-4-amino-4,6-dideoxy-L-N-acetyl-beta-L-altrosamine transaminase